MKSRRIGLQLLVVTALTVGFAAAAAADGRPARYGETCCYSWSGLYLGLQTGYSAINLDPSGPQPTGGFWGGQIGANYQLSRNWVVGVEINSAWARLEDSNTYQPVPGDLQTDTIRINSITVAQARLGYASAGTLVYATGGRGWLGVQLNEADSSPGLPVHFFADKLTVHGWTAGVGIEQRLWPNFSAKLEYQFFRAPDTTVVDDRGPSTFQIDMHTLRLGVNWQFR